ncbi:unnamed protein product [Musa textilis]
MSCSFASLLVAPLLFPHHSKKLILPRRRARAAITSSLRLGVDDLAELAHNKVLVAAAISGAVGQLSKPLTSAIRTGKGIDLWAAVSAGGMPSTHSAAVAAAATSLGLERGFSDSIFGVSVVFAFLVMYDAQGVRREVGSHAKILNKIRSSQEEDDVQSPSARSSSVNCEKMSPFASISEKAESYRPNSESYSFRGPGFTSTKYSNYPVLNESVGHTEVQVLVGAMLARSISIQRPPKPNHHVQRLHSSAPAVGHIATASAAMDPRLQPQPDLDRLWANEIRYLHSLWRRGPPPNRNRNPRVSSGPDPDPLHATRVAFKRESKRKERMPTETAASPRRPDEAGTSDPPLVDSWAKLASLTAPNPNPPTAWADVARPPFVERPPVSAEEQARLAAAQLHHDGLKASQDFFSKIGESDDEEEAHEEGEEEEDDKEEKDGRQLEAFKFFMELFDKDDELTEYYKKNHDKGEFSCFACAAIGTKRVRKFGNCLGLVQHANSISKTKRRGAHRALARAVCQVLGWDTIRSAGVVLDLGDTGGQSSAGAAKTQVICVAYS